jgi:uncharacterized protein (TIGR03437 family)
MLSLRFGFDAIGGLLLAFPCAVCAQGPVIKSVLNSASLDTRLAPGTVAALQYQSATAFNIQADTVEVGGRPVPVSDDETGNSVTIRLPRDLPLGQAAVVLTIAAKASDPFAITIDEYSAGIFPPSRYRYDRWTGTPLCNNPAAAGDILYLTAVGLGAGNPAEIHPIVTVGQTVAEVIGPVERFTEVGEDGVRGGFQSIQFKVPPGDGMRLVYITVAGHRSNSVSLPVGRAMLNVASPSFQAGPAAAESMQSALSCNGSDLASISSGQVLWGALPDLPTTLGGTTITVRDSAGITRPAPLIAATRNQINYIVPAGTAIGVATVTALAGSRFIAAGDIEIGVIAPAFFYRAQIVRLRGGVQTIEEVSNFTVNVDLGPETDQVSLVLYATGIRGIRSAAAVVATIGGVEVPVAYAGAQGTIPGLDQVNLHLPRSFAGVGPAELRFSIEGKPANVLFLNFQ